MRSISVARVGKSLPIQELPTRVRLLRHTPREHQRFAAPQKSRASEQDEGEPGRPGHARDFWIGPDDPYHVNTMWYDRTMAHCPIGACFEVKKKSYHVGTSFLRGVSSVVGMLPVRTPRRICPWATVKLDEGDANRDELPSTARSSALSVR